MGYNIIRKPVGTKGVLHKFYQTTCKKCLIDLEVRVNGFEKWSGHCKKCADELKLSKARKTGDCNRIKPYEALYNRLKVLADKKNINISLTYKEFLTFVNRPYCHYCLERVYFSKYNFNDGYAYNLDRKDNNKKIGYTKKNCVTCCWRCNNSRSNLFTYEEWFAMTDFLRKRAQYRIDREYYYWNDME